MTAPASPPGAAGAGADVMRVRAVHAAALGVPGVVALSSAGGTGTSLPDGRVDGVRVRPTHTEVDVRAAWGRDLIALARDIRAAVGAVRPGPVTVRIVEIDEPDPPTRRRRTGQRKSAGPGTSSVSTTNQGRTQ